MEKYNLKTETNKVDHSLRNLILICFILIASLTLIFSIFLHLTPLEILIKLASFAVHHYFLTSFIALVVILVCIKLYVTKSQVKKIGKENYLRKLNLKRKKRINDFGISLTKKINKNKTQ